MSKNSHISISVIRRLPRYFRFLEELSKKKMDRISSRELAELMGLTASQIRQDLNCFGGFGQQGYGYNVTDLLSEISTILGVNSQLKTILIGVGNLGRAVATHMNFEKRGFVLSGAFDNSLAIIGSMISDVTIQHIDSLEEFCKEQSPQVAILCLPKEAAPTISARLVELGIKGFWNFSHYDMTDKHKDIIVENVHMGDSLMTLSYRVNNLLE